MIVVVGAKSVVRGAVLLAVAGGKENGLGGQLYLQLLSQLREVWPLHWQYLNIVGEISKMNCECFYHIIARGDYMNVVTL